MSRLKTNFNPSLKYSAHKSLIVYRNFSMTEGLYRDRSVYSRRICIVTGLCIHEGSVSWSVTVSWEVYIVMSLSVLWRGLYCGGSVHVSIWLCIIVGGSAWRLTCLFHCGPVRIYYTSRIKLRAPWTLCWKVQTLKSAGNFERDKFISII